MVALVWLRAAAVAALATQAVAQQCYYPNGKKAPDGEKPCSSAEGSACCPDKWECLDNGLCHYPPDQLYGRYSCTDKSWKAEGCASNMCTSGMTAPGGESITQCSDHDDQWCCNADAQNVNCCKESPSPRPFFALQDGNAYATIGQNQASTAPNLATITGLATSGSGSGGGNSASRTSAQPSSAAPSTDGSNSDSASATTGPDSVSATPTPFSSVVESLSTGPAGVVTIENTILVTPTATPSSSNPAAGNNDNGDSNSGSSSNLGLIIGCAVGIPLALALVGIIFWLFRKRRQQKAANPYKDSTEVEGDSPLVGGAAGKLSKKEAYRHSRPATAEIDGNPVGAGRSNRISELPSGNGFQPGQGTPYGPDAVGIGGGNGDPNRMTWDTIPPQYSPAHHQAAFSHPEATELADTSVNPVLNEKGQAYQAYRPPRPVAELPSVTTPPEDLEKQMRQR